ncbi:hypothetical protein ABZW03_37810, partial [Kitasatospora sp. NPDC004799]
MAVFRRPGRSRPRPEPDQVKSDRAEPDPSEPDPSGPDRAEPDLTERLAELVEESERPAGQGPVTEYAAKQRGRGRAVVLHTARR